MKIKRELRDLNPDDWEVELFNEIDRLRKENEKLREKGVEEATNSYSLEGEIEALERKLARAREALRSCVDNIQGCLDGTDLPSMAIRDNARATLEELSDED